MKVFYQKRILFVKTTFVRKSKRILICKRNTFLKKNVIREKKYLKIIFSLQMCTKKHADRTMKKNFTEKITSNKSASMFAFMLMAKSKKRRYFFSSRCKEWKKALALRIECTAAAVAALGALFFVSFASEWLYCYV